jgi:glycosyltransferase involved in cell wall biosynthesis
MGQTINLCKSITAFYPQMIINERSETRKRLLHQLSLADVVHVFRFQEFVANINHKCIVWDIDELPWQLREAGRNAGLGPISRDQQKSISDAFLDCVNKCQMVFACSPEERLENQADITVIPNVVINPEITEFESPGKSPSLLFVGNLNFLPNIDGLDFFRQSVLPIVSRDIPDLKVTVVGRSPVTDEGLAAVKSLQETDRFQFMFDVPSCTPYYLQASASIVPLRFGGGTRIKIIESFAHRCPVISTTKGCEGLDVEHKKELLIADSPADFASACLEAIQDAQPRIELTETAHAFFEQFHSQQVVDDLLMSTVGRLA